MKQLTIKSRDSKVIFEASWHLGASKKFQGLGFIFSADNPVIDREYYLIKWHLLFITYWLKIYQVE